MSAIKVFSKKFSGAGEVHDAGGNGLAACIRGLAQDHARIKVENAGVSDVTDNSTGVVAVAVAAMVVPTVAFDGQSAGAAPATAFNTAVGKIENAAAVLADSMNNVRVRLGLPLVGLGDGAIAATDVVPAQDVSLSVTSGATAIDFTTGIAAMKGVRNNVGTLAEALNEIAEALGEPRLTNAAGGTPDFAGKALASIDNATAGTGGTAGETSIDDTVMDAFLLASAANIATLADKWNAMMGQAVVADLTDDSGGTAANGMAAAISTTLTAHQDGSTDSAPQAGLAAEIPKIDNDIADLALRTNLLLDRHGLGQLTDNSGGTASTTLEVIDFDLTEVNGTGPNAAPIAGTQAIVDAISANLATLAAKVALLAPLFGVIPLVDSSGGVVSTTDTLVATASIGAAVDNGASAIGMAGAEVDPWLAAVTDGLGALAVKLNEMTGADVPTKPLHVVASA